MSRGGVKNVLGNNIRELRQTRGLNQEDVAKALGISSPTYSSWERGRTEPSIDGLLSLARYFDVSVDRLLRSESRILKIGSWLEPPERFHPIKEQSGIFAMIYRMVFNHLYYYDIFERRFHVELVDSWLVNRSSDEPGYTFYVRSNVKFHNGDPLQLEDIKSSYELFRDQFPILKQFIDSVEIRREEHAIELRLRKWIELEYIPSPYIIPRSCVERAECFEGTGPFMLVDEEQRDKVRGGLKQPVMLERNNEYYGKMAAIEAVEVQRFNSLERMKASLENGNIDFAYSFELRNSEKSGDFVVKHGHSTHPFYLVLKPESKICSDRNVRMAVDCAIDRNRILERIGVEEAELLPSSHLYLLLREEPSEDEGSRYDQAKARESWEAAKDSLNQKGITDFVLKICPAHNDPVLAEIANEIVEQLKETGISAEEIKLLDDDREGNKRKIKEADALVEIVKFSTLIALYENLHSSRSPFRNWSYNDSLIDDSLDDIKGMDTFRTIQESLSSTRFFLPLFHRGIVVTHTKDLDMRSRLRLTNVPYGPDMVHWEFK